MNNEIMIGLNKKGRDELLTFNTSTNFFTIHHNNREQHNDITSLIEEENREVIESIPTICSLHYLTYIDQLGLFYQYLVSPPVIDKNKYKYHNEFTIKNGKLWVFTMVLFSVTGTIRKLITQNKQERLVPKINNSHIQNNYKLSNAVPFLFNSMFPWLNKIESYMQSALIEMDCTDITIELFAELINDSLKENNRHDSLFDNLIFDIFSNGTILKIDGRTTALYNELCLRIYCDYAIVLCDMAGRETGNTQFAKVNIDSICEIANGYLQNTDMGEIKYV